MTLGNLADARLIFAAYHDGGKIPGGWEEIGSGSTRTVFLSPDGVVYKVGDSYINHDEARAARRYRGQKRLTIQDIFIPRTHLWRVDDEEWVIAMEYINSVKETYCATSAGGECYCRVEGEPRACFGWIMEYLEDIGLCDVFYGNVLYADDGRFYIIDLGAE